MRPGSGAMVFLSWRIRARETALGRLRCDVAAAVTRRTKLVDLDTNASDPLPRACVPCAVVVVASLFRNGNKTMLHRPIRPTWTGYEHEDCHVA